MLSANPFRARYLAIVLAAAGAFTIGAPLTGKVRAEGNTVTSDSTTLDQESVESKTKHLYGSPSERAQDDLLITEVKNALAADGVANGHAVGVDCDHGTIQLSGTVSSADDARHAAVVAANVDGVVAVKNQLRWR